MPANNSVEIEAWSEVPWPRHSLIRNVVIGNDTVAVNSDDDGVAIEFRGHAATAKITMPHDVYKRLRQAIADHLFSL